MTSTVLGIFSSPLLPSMSVQLILCPHLYCLSIIVLVCLCFFFLRIFHVVHCVEFGQLSFFPNRRNLRWTTLSSRVVWLPNASLLSSFLSFCILVTPAILCSCAQHTAQVFKSIQHTAQILNSLQHCPSRTEFLCKL